MASASISLATSEMVAATLFPRASVRAWAATPATVSRWAPSSAVARAYPSIVASICSTSPIGAA